VVKSMSCPNCALPVKPGQAFCAGCGTSLAGSLGGPAEIALTGAVPTPEPAAESAPEPPPAWTPEPAQPPAPGLDPALLSDPMAAASGRIPGGYVWPEVVEPPAGQTLQPSSSSSLGARSPGASPSLSVGAIPVSQPVPAPPPLPASAPPAGPAPAVFAAAASPTQQLPPAPVSVSASVRAALPQSTRELVAFSLSTVGGAVGIASFFLPWTGVVGMGVGSTGDKIAPNRWAFDMPAGIPLLLITVLILAAVAGSDRVQVELPKLAVVIGRATDIILPMLLAGIYLGVALLYATLPWGYGMGIVILLIAACLLVAGSAASIFFPPEPAKEAK